MTNTDNRLLASATRLAIEPTLGALITEDQRGFIGGRSMLANLVDIDEATVTYSLDSSDTIDLFMISLRLFLPSSTVCCTIISLLWGGLTGCVA